LFGGFSNISKPEKDSASGEINSATTDFYLLETNTTIFRLLQQQTLTLSLSKYQPRGMQSMQHNVISPNANWLSIKMIHISVSNYYSAKVTCDCACAVSSLMAI
jgi:hypothetical protein